MTATVEIIDDEPNDCGEDPFDQVPTFSLDTELDAEGERKIIEEIKQLFREQFRKLKEELHPDTEPKDTSEYEPQGIYRYYRDNYRYEIEATAEMTDDEIELLCKDYEWLDTRRRTYSSGLIARIRITGTPWQFTLKDGIDDGSR